MSAKAPATFEVLAADGRRVRLGRDEYWRTVAEPAMRSAWDDPHRLYPMALQALDEGFARELLPVAERLFRLAKGLEIGALVLAEAQRKAGLLDACEQTLRDQLQRTGPSAFLLLNLAKVEGDRGRWQEELRLLGESVRLDPLSDPAQVGLLLLELLWKVGRQSDAEALLRLIESRARQGFGGPRPPGTDQAILEQAQRLRARLGLT